MEQNVVLSLGALSESRETRGAIGSRQRQGLLLTLANYVSHYCEQILANDRFDQAEMEPQQR